jgi:acyl dehydratase
MSTKALSSPPSLAPLYAKAAVTGRLHRGDTLPDSVYEVADQHVDLGHLADYERVCRFPVGDQLPPTYLHVLAFPLSVALMTERAFPFPLVGLVHVANSITVARPVRGDETISLRVHAADLRAHAAGRQLDLVADAIVSGNIVWSSRSTYLHREGKPDGDAGRPKDRIAGEPPPGAVALVQVHENIGRRYGAVSGDRNPIHIHQLTARAFGFPKAIAHGMWLKARTLATLEGRLPAAYTVDVAFKTPVFLPSTVAVTTAPQNDGWLLDVRNAKSGKPHLAGSVTPA